MKKTFVSILVFCFLASASFAIGPHIGLSLDAKTVNYSTSLGSYSSSNNLDPIFGLGIAIGVPLKESLSMRFEGQYNTIASFTNGLGVKTDISIYPLQLSLQNNIAGVYFGGGINYTLWTSSIGGNNINETNGLGYQIYAGLDSLLFGNLEVKYTMMNASFSILGSTINQAAGTLSLGTKFWIN